MKTLITLTTIALTFTFPSIVMSQESNPKMSQEEFTQFVCAYIEAMDRETAIEAVKSEAMSLFTEQQISTLDEIKDSEQAGDQLCRS